MKSSTRVPGAGSVAKRRRLWFGPGTLLAILIAGAALSLRSLGTQAESAANAGRIIYQADAQGRMRRVDAAQVAVPQAPIRPFWKPEVSLLLHGDLKLNASQRASIARLDQAWRRDKADLEASLQAASSGTSATLAQTSEKHGAALQLIQRGLADYSSISREFNARREDYWRRGYALLDRAQRESVDRIAGAPERVRTK